MSLKLNKTKESINIQGDSLETVSRLVARYKANGGYLSCGKVVRRTG